MSDVSDLAKKIHDLAEDVSRYNNFKSQLTSFLKDVRNLSIEEALKKKEEVLKGKSEKEWLDFYDSYIFQQLGEIEKVNDVIISALRSEEGKTSLKSSTRLPRAAIAEVASAQKTAQPVILSKEFISLDNSTKAAYLKELKVEVDYLRGLMPYYSSDKKLTLPDYTIYQSSPLGNLANSFFENYSLKLSKAYPQFFDGLFHNLRTADIKILSKTYVSIMLFSALIASFLFFLLALIFVDAFIVFRILGALLIGFFGGCATFAGFYFYPSMVANSRKRLIKDDLPFVILHMSAVAGSGAQPISMFNLIMSSGDYKGIEGEIKKIVNYVNLFGYNFTTALRAVALTTPSEDFKDLLNGLVTNIESGGDLKAFLTGKADEAMTNYKLERTKYVETLSTYSDVYTGVLIAAPLLFFITLAIIRMFGTQIMGVSISTLASLGIYGLIPLLNVGFILFLNTIQPST